MDPGLLIPLALAVAFGSVYLVNEWSEGTFAETMGLGAGHHVHASIQDRCLVHGAGDACDGVEPPRMPLVSARAVPEASP